MTAVSPEAPARRALPRLFGRSVASNYASSVVSLLLAQGTKLASTLQVADVAFQDTARSDREALQMLVKGRTAAVYGQDVNLREAARGAGLEGQVRIGPQVFEEETQYAVVSRRLPEPVVERLTERLRQLSASGEIARLAERYR